MSAANNDSMTTKRIEAGCYQVTIKGQTFSVESESFRASLGDYSGSGRNQWILTERTADDGPCYWNHFSSKSDAIQAIRDAQ